MPANSKTTKKFSYVVLGGGGHARVLIDGLLTMGVSPSTIAILDVNPSLWGTRLMGIFVAGGEELLSRLAQKGKTRFVVGLGATGDNSKRQRLYEKALSFGLKPFTVIHPSAVVSRNAVLGPGCQILAGGIVNAGARLGANVIVNSGAIVEHDCIIADHVHIATGARLASTVLVGQGAHVGAGATVRQLIKIGDSVIVGAGAVVVKDVASGMVVVGVPARPLKNLQRFADAMIVASRGN